MPQRREHYNLHGDRLHEVYEVPRRGLDAWDAVTDIPCPVDGCQQTVVWYEAGYVPGYRVCMAAVGVDAKGIRTFDYGTLRHRFVADISVVPAILIRDDCCEAHAGRDER
jgi:hypothetical protein